MTARDELVRYFDETAGLYAPEAYADGALSALRAAGFVVVPVEPTEAMVSAALNRTTSLGAPVMAVFYGDIYRAMLAAQEAPDATVRISAVTLANLADAAETQIIGSYPNAILYPPQRKAMEAELAPVREAREALRAVTDCSTAAAPRRP